MNFLKSHISIIILALLICSSSCSHYSIVSDNSTPFKTIYINTILNKDFAPNVQMIFQNQIKHLILKDGRISISNDKDQADVQLFISIEDYKRNVSTLTEKDSGRYNSLNLWLTVTISLYDNFTNTYYMRNIPITNHENVFFNPGGSKIHNKELEYQILPKITRELSKETLQLILSHWELPINK